MRLALMSFLLAMAIWSYQAFVWLQTGMTPEYPLYQVEREAQKKLVSTLQQIKGRREYGFQQLRQPSLG